MFVEHPTVINKNRRRLVYGVGTNDADYLISYKDVNGVKQRCPYYSVWSGVLERCFSARRHASQPSYKGCTLHEPWKSFSNFKDWMKTQEWENKHIDKDLLSWENKHYSPNTCLFITPALNNLLCLRRNHRGDTPLGVSRTSINKYEYFVASCSFYGKQKRLGYFKTSEEAQEVYQHAKMNYIKELAQAETDPRIRHALENLH